MEQKDVWNAIAIDWRKFREKMPVEVQEFLDGASGKVLDLGCGTGRNFLNRKGLEFYGHDFSDRMIKLAGKYASEKGLDVTLSVGESYEIPYADKFFDSVLCSLVLHCVDSTEKRKKSVEEIYRVLKSGGKAFVSVWSRGSPRIRNRERECFVPWKKEYMRYTYIFEMDELIELCKSVGFEIIESVEDKNINLIVRRP